jgi:hypothetical protein
MADYSYTDDNYTCYKNACIKLKKKLILFVLWLIILAQIYTTKQILLQIDCNLM